MRTLAILGVLCAGQAHAEADDGPTLPHRALGWGLDGQGLDIGGGQAAGFGLDGVAAFGHGRLALLLEGGAGGLMATHPSDAIGAFASARIGGRLLVAATNRDPFSVDLVVDAGVGEGVYWLDGAGFLNRPQAFVGWGTLLGGEHHAVHFELRVAVSPKLDDAAAMQVICRGTCMAPSNAPVDLTMQFLFGVVSW
jgi:hypothetical protein